MNQITITGNLGRDPELKYTPQGKAVCKFSVAVQDGYGEQKKTYWFDVVCWEKKAEFVSKYIKKGVTVLCSGKLTQRHWEKDGVKRTAFEITAFEVESFSRSKPEEKPAETEPAQEPDQTDYTADGGGDVPF